MTDKKTDDDLEQSAALIQKLAASLIAMTSRIMQPAITKELITDVDRHIKLFLSVLTHIDDKNITLNMKKVNKKTKKENVARKRKINTTSNLTTLLNIPDFMRLYGPPRLYWEGGFKGEGVLRSVKPVGHSRNTYVLVCYGGVTKVLQRKKHEAVTTKKPGYERTD
jgi:hypothetical protein